MTKQSSRAVSQFEFVWGSYTFRQVGPAYDIATRRFRLDTYVDPWRRIDKRDARGPTVVIDLVRMGLWDGLERGCKV